MNKLYALLLISTGIPALAATYTVAAGSSASTIQAALNNAAAGSTVTFQAGTYNITTPLIVPCALNLTLTGPIASPATAVLVASYSGNPIMILYECSGITIEYLGFDGGMPPAGGGGGIYVGAPSNNTIISHNTFYGNQAGSGNVTSMAGVYFDGSASTTDTNDVVTWNSFGATGNCSNVMSEEVDNGGWCAGFVAGTSFSNLTVSNNKVYYQEEGLKILPQLNCDGCTFDNNDLSNIHRIGIELQVFTTVGSLVVEHNDYHDPFVPYFYTFGISTPCCSTVHGATDSDNVLLANVPPYDPPGVTDGYIAMGIELWGAGSGAQNNLVQGYWANGIMWGYWGVGTINNNRICGPNMAATSSYVANEEGEPQPTIAPNTTSASCSAVTSTAPVISVSGSTVSLKDSGMNHSIYYTTDGTTPTTSSKLYTAPFSAPGVTVKAIGMWGQGANPASYPASYGYVPSSVVTSSVAGVPAATAKKTLASAYLGSTGSANKMTKGGTLQFTAYGVYSDGSVATLPDKLGNSVTGWNTSNHSVAKISTGGHATALAAGTANIVATIGTLKASPWGVTVTAPAPAAQAAPVAAAQPAVAPEAQAAQAPAAQAALAPDSEAAPVADPTSTTAASGPVPAAPGAALGDSFQGPLWKLVTPAGGSASISNGHLFLGVPGGSNHDPLLPSNQAVRVVQAIGDENFDVSIKIDSPLVATDADTSQGLMAFSDSQDFITFALSTDGTKIGLSAHTVSGGAATAVLDDTDFSQYQNPIYLRLTRTGSAYVALYSVDGANWMQAASFTDSEILTSIGPFAGNYNATPANALPVVMSVNWFDIQ